MLICCAEWLYYYLKKTSRNSTFRAKALRQELVAAIYEYYNHSAQHFHIGTTYTGTDSFSTYADMTAVKCLAKLNIVIQNVKKQSTASNTCY